MAKAAIGSLLRSLHSIVGGVVVGPDESPSPYPTLLSLRGDHPLPGRHSFAAAAKIAEVTPGHRSNDTAVVLLSGGTTSLIGAPLKGMSEGDLTALYEMLLGSGLDIKEMNAVRKRFSRWGAGRLALALAPAATHCFAVSDVADDDLSVIGSGPCAPDTETAADIQAILERAGLLPKLPETYRDYLTAVRRGTIPDTPNGNHPAFAHVSSRVIANNRNAVDGAADAARKAGLQVEVSSTRLAGEASRAGEAIARHLIARRAAGVRSHVAIYGGETTVTVTGSRAGPSGGGRCQELALAAARVLHEAGDDAVGITLLAAGTDGRDGATDAAGAIIDASTWNAILATGRDPAHALAAHESNGALRAGSALIGRRETGTNVNDIVAGLIE